MTKDQFDLYASALVRHVLTAGAGLLAARGLITNSDTPSNIIAAVAVFAAAVGWSFIQKHKLLAQLFEAAQPSQVEQLLGQAAQFKQQGANPLLVAHMIGTALALAQDEVIAAGLMPQQPAAPAAPSVVVEAAPVAADTAVEQAPAPAPVGGSSSDAAQGSDAIPLTDGVTP